MATATVKKELSNAELRFAHELKVGDVVIFPKRNGSIRKRVEAVHLGITFSDNSELSLKHYEQRYVEKRL